MELVERDMLFITVLSLMCVVFSSFLHCGGELILIVIVRVA